MPKSSGIEIALAVFVAFAFLGCERAAKSENGEQHYETRGVVRGFSPDRQIVEIQHENIPGFMPSMTMPFSTRDPKEIADLRIGEAISFRMTVTKKDFWIDHVKEVRREDVNVPEPKATPEISTQGGSRLHEGDQMPFFGLTNQNGERVMLENFRGRPLILTFVFTRCPIPNFCPLMSSNFAELQNAIKNGSGNLLQARLLSITLDPEFDTPEILKQYGESHGADPKIWTFATGDAKEIEALTRAFSVYVRTEGGTISHGLATALIDKDGKIEKIWRGNAWKPDEVIKEINQPAR
jgi:protein SCO1/2